MADSPGIWPPSTTEKPVPHYYGDYVRALFIVADILLLISIPLDRVLLPLNVMIGVVGVLVITILAGYTNPRSKFSILADSLIAALLFVSYEYFAIEGYLKAGTFADRIFLLREGIAVLALLALYYSTKSLRGLSYRGPNS